MSAYLGFLYRHNRASLLLALLLLLLSAFTEGIGLALILPLIQWFNGERAWPEFIATVFRHLGLSPSLGSVLTGLFIALVLRSSLNYWREVVLLRIRLQTTDLLRNQLFSAVLQSSWQRLSQLHHARISEQLTGGILRVGQANFFLLRCMTSGIMLLFYLVVTLHVAPLSLVVCLLVGVAVFIGLRRFQRDAARAGSELTDLHRQLQERILFNLQGLKSIKAFAQERTQMQSMVNTQAALAENQLQFQQQTGLVQWLFSVVSAALLCLVVFVGLTFLQLQVETLLLLVLVVARAMPLLADFQTNLQRLTNTVPAFADISEHYQWLCTQRELQPVAQEPLQLPKQQIALRHAQVHYNPVLTLTFDLSLPVGQFIVLKGASGVGKTTAADLFAGLLQPAAGALYLDDHAVPPTQLAQWRSHVVYLTQEPFLFAGTLRDNVRWGMSLDDSSITQALADVGADFVSQLADGLDSQIGERGLLLSGGQRQRVLLARALCRRPSLLILDEASNALDEATERQWLQTLVGLRPQLTILVITHQGIAEQFADLVIELTKESSNVSACTSVRA